MVEYAKQYILENYENKTYKELVDDLSEYQVTQDQIRYILKVNKLKKPASIFSAKDDEFIKQNYLNMSYSEIGSILGFNEYQLTSRIHYLGLKKYRTVNDNYFENIDTPLKAYFLGFIYADGWVMYKPEQYYYCFSIKLQSKDKYLLDKLNNELGGNCLMKHEKPSQKIIMGINSMNNGTDQIVVHSKKLVSDLMNLNILPNKSYKKDIPYIPNEFFFDWLRGFIDGDGCISNSGKYRLQLSIVGNNDELFKILQDKLLLEYEIETKIYKKGSSDNTYNLYCGKRNDLIRLINLLYYDNCFCLERKFSKAKKYYGLTA